MQLNDPWQPWLGNMGEKRATLGLNQGDMEKKVKQSFYSKRIWFKIILIFKRHSNPRSNLWKKFVIKTINSVLNSLTVSINILLTDRIWSNTPLRTYLLLIEQNNQALLLAQILFYSIEKVKFIFIFKYVVLNLILIDNKLILVHFNFLEIKRYLLLLILLNCFLFTT